MIDYNAEFKKFILEFNQNPSSCDFEKAFNRYKRFLCLYKYNDPSGVLQREDIEVVAQMGFWKAIKKYNPSRWENALSWTYYIVRQQILREIKKTYNGSNTHINSHMDPNLDLNNFFDSIGEENEEYNYIEDFSIQLKDLQEFYSRIEDISIKAAKVFQLRLLFPSLSRTSISRILGFKRRNALAKLVKIIRANAIRHLNPELVDGRFKDPYKK